MTPYFKLNQRFVRASQAAVHLERYHSLGGMLKSEADGSYCVIVPCGRRPFTVEKHLLRLDPESQWDVIAIDEGAAEIMLDRNPHSPVLVEGGSETDDDEHEYLADSDGVA